MNIPPSDHVLWKILRLAVVGGLLTALLHFNYLGFDKRDVLTILITLGGLGGFDVAKSAMTKPPAE